LKIAEYVVLVSMQSYC